MDQVNCSNYFLSTSLSHFLYLNGACFCLDKNPNNQIMRNGKWRSNLEGSTLRARDGGGGRISQLERKIEQNIKGDELNQDVFIKRP